MTLHIYHVSRIVDAGDTQIMVVAAPDAETARKVARPGGVHIIMDEDGFLERDPAWSSTPDRVEVECIGVAAEGVQQGIIVSTIR